eukprot:TRINITY_DN9374_c0_g1_i5.p1 TRINITY_DN9374_c0_g1~~TRINITY_DN9374_c0_g1_i5.p1  ORF type:complete len:510 (+),score=75.23 TRINITY_DN9374_c0_g1_i5:139-1530(+)
MDGFELLLVKRLIELRDQDGNKIRQQIAELPSIIDDVLSVRIKDHLYLNVSAAIDQGLRDEYQQGLCNAFMSSLAPIYPDRRLPQMLVESAALGLTDCVRHLVLDPLVLSHEQADALLRHIFRRCDMVLLKQVVDVRIRPLYHYAMHPQQLLHCPTTTFEDVCKGSDVRHQQSLTVRAVFCQALLDFQAPSASKEHLQDTTGAMANCTSLLPTIAATDSTATATHIQHGRPMLIQGLVSTDHHHTFNWSQFVESHGHEDFQVSGIPYGDVFGEDAGYGTLAEMAEYMSQHFSASILSGETWLALQAKETVTSATIANELCNALTSAPLYIFDAQAASDATEWRTLDLPIFHSALIQLYEDSCQQTPTLYQQLYVGPTCSGAPWHYHQDAWNHLVQGSKLWWLEPPANSYYSKQPPYDSKDGKHSSTLACIQHAGETLFVPAQWSHQTLNLQRAVGFALEARVN